MTFDPRHGRANLGRVSPTKGKTITHEIVARYEDGRLQVVSRAMGLESAQKKLKTHQRHDVRGRRTPGFRWPIYEIRSKGGEK